MGRESRVARGAPKSVKKKRPDFYEKVYPIKLQRRPSPFAKQETK